MTRNILCKTGGWSLYKINQTTRLLRHHFNLWLIIAFIFSIGTFAPFCLEFIKIGFQSSLQGRLKTLLGSDVVISSRLVLPVEQINHHVGAEADRVMVKSLYTMTRASQRKDQNKSRLTQLTFVPKGFPFYGKLVPDHLRESFFQGRKILVWPELLNLLDLKVGDYLIVGNFDFQIIGEIENDPGQVTQGQSLAPRVYLSQSHESSLGLIQKGSTVRYSYHFKFPNQEVLESSYKVLKEKFDKEGVSVRNAEENGQFIGRTVRIINDFLGLGSFLCLILSMLAISFVLNKMFKREQTSLSNLRQLGIPYQWVLSLYLKPFLLTSLVASSLSSLGGFALSPLIAEFLKVRFKLDIQLLPGWYILLFTLMSLISLIVFYFPIALQYLKQMYGDVVSAKKIQAGYGVAGVWVCLVAFYWTNSWKLLGLVILGTVLLGAAISILGHLYFKLVEKIVSMRQYPVLRLGVLQMTRYKKHSLVTIFLLTSSIGIFGLINSIAEGLETGLNYDIGDKRPEMFLFDIQPEQTDPLEKLVVDFGGSIRKMAPMVRARLVKIDGQELRVEKKSIKTQEDERKDRFLKRGVNLSYQNKLFSSEEVIQGEDFFSKPASDAVWISVEEGYAKLLDLKINSSMTFEVLGVEVQGIVKNIRKINWQSFDPNFFIVLSKGHLEEAPQTFVASLNLPEQNVGSFQNKLFDQLPNISSLDVRRVIQRIVNIISKVRGIFKVYGVFIILLGAVIIFGLLHLHWEDRIKDMSFFKLMGIDGVLIGRIMTYELSFIFVFSTLLSLAFQVLLSTFILYEIFDVGLVSYWSILETLILCSLIFIGLMSFNRFRNQRRSHHSFQKDV